MLPSRLLLAGLAIFGLVLSVAATAQSSAAAAELHASAESERLLFKVAYRGLLTSYIWMELADVEGVAYARRDKFKQFPVCHARLSLDTQNYHFAEMVHPLRYSWSVRLKPDLTRTYYIEEVDLGVNDFHNITWMNYPKKRIDLFRKREKRLKTDNTWERNMVEYWEPDHIKQPLPDFLDRHPRLDNGATYLMRDKVRYNIDTGSILDPLGLIYNVRRHDFAHENPYTLNASTDHNYHPYTIELRDRKVIEYQDRQVAAFLIVIRRADEKAAKKEGEMRMYLADDPWRTPLLFEVDAPLGKMRVLLEQAERDEALLADPDSCHTIPDGKPGAWERDSSQ